jgi:hypothetical protein
MNKEDNYYNKKEVYGTSPLTEIIYEIEDAYEYDCFSETEYVSKDKLQDIIHRHSNTIKEFKKRLANLFD